MLGFLPGSKFGANWELQAGCWSVSGEAVGLSLEEGASEQLCCLWSWENTAWAKLGGNKKTSTHSPLPVWRQVLSGTTSLVEDEDSNPGSAFTRVCHLLFS